MVRAGLIGVSILRVIQVDTNSFVACSSVVRINFLLAALFALVKVAFTAGLIAIISHGLCSSGLFYKDKLVLGRARFARASRKPKEDAESAWVSRDRLLVANALSSLLPLLSLLIPSAMARRTAAIDVDSIR